MNLFEFSPVLPSLFLTCLLQVTLLSVIVAPLYLIARRFNSNAGAVTAIAGLVGVLLLTLMAASPWPHWDPSSLLAKTRSTMPTKSAAVSVENSSMSPDESLALPQEPLTALPELESESPLLVGWNAFVKSLGTVANEPVQTVAANETSFDWISIILLLAVVGIAFFLLRTILALISVRKLVKASVAIDDSNLLSQFEAFKKLLSGSKSVTLRQSAQIPTPATVGWWNPTILLPEDWRAWSKPEIDAVLAHELAHVASGDYLSWVVARFTVALHFYHPVVRWLATRLQLEQELAADEVAANLLGDRKQYLHSLASLALATPVHQMAGPARTLIPQQSLLSRRVEMLRTNNPRSSSNARFIRLTAFAMTAMAAIAIAGFFKPAIGQQAIGESPTPSPTPSSTPSGAAVVKQDSAKAKRIPLTLVPKSASGVVSLRSKELLERDAFSGFADRLSQVQNIKSMLEIFDVSIRDVQEVMVISAPDKWFRLAIQFDTPERCQHAIERALMRRGGVVMPKSNINGLDTWQDDVDKPSGRLTKLDDLTFVMEELDGGGSERSTLPEIKNPLPAWANEWFELKDRQLIAAGQLDQAFKSTIMKAGGEFQLSGGFPLQAVSPLIQNTRWAVAGIGLLDQAKVDLVAECDSPDDAEKVAKTLQALMSLASNIVAEQEAATLANIAQSTDPKEAALKPVAKSAFKIASDFLNKAEPKANGQRVRLTFTYPIDEAELAIATDLLIPALESFKTNARRIESSNKMKQLGLSLHNYEAEHRHLPAASNYEYVDDSGAKKRSKHAHSWRVDMLPYLERKDLWKQYRFEEPWDSDANKKVLAAMPHAFLHPMDEPGSTNTSYFAITGPETVFAGEAGTKFEEITDGLANTIMLVEAKRAVPWTKPEDIPYAKEKPLEKLGGWFEGVFVTCFADGSVHTLSESIDESILRALITKSGGENKPK